MQPVGARWRSKMQAESESNDVKRRREVRAAPLITRAFLVLACPGPFSSPLRPAPHACLPAGCSPLVPSSFRPSASVCCSVSTCYCDCDCCCCCRCCWFFLPPPLQQCDAMHHPEDCLSSSRPVQQPFASHPCSSQPAQTRRSPKTPLRSCICG